MENHPKASIFFTSGHGTGALLNVHRSKDGKNEIIGKITVNARWTADPNVSLLTEELRVITEKCDQAKKLMEELLKKPL